MRRLRVTLARHAAPLRRRTLSRRLAAVAVVATAIWLTLLTVAFNVTLADRLRHQADDLLRTRATAVAETIEVDQSGGLVLHEAVDDQSLDSNVWIYQGHQLVDGSSADTPRRRLADLLAGQGNTFTQSGEPHAFRMYALPISSAGRQVGTVVVSVGLDPYRGSARSALIGSIVVGLLVLGGVYVVTALLVGRALHPVAEMSSQAAQWSAASGENRFGAEGRPAELAALATNLDEMLERLGAVLRREQRLTAELSHELRNPLAMITAEAEWLTARTRSPAEYETSVAAISASAAVMRGICESLLTDARGRVEAGNGRCALQEVARAVAARASADPLVDKRIDVYGEARAGVEAHVAERILAPLVDNAHRYAASAVLLSCGSDVDGSWLAVHDDGPGVPPGIADRVFDAGVRGDPGDGHDGVGLGLSLARRLAREAGGDLSLDSCDHGARFVIRLPAG